MLDDGDGKEAWLISGLARGARATDKRRPRFAAGTTKENWSHYMSMGQTHFRVETLYVGNKHYLSGQEARRTQTRMALS